MKGCIDIGSPAKLRRPIAASDPLRPSPNPAHPDLICPPPHVSRILAFQSTAKKAHAISTVTPCYTSLRQKFYLPFRPILPPTHHVPPKGHRFGPSLTIRAFGFCHSPLGSSRLFPHFPLVLLSDSIFRSAYFHPKTLDFLLLSAFFRIIFLKFPASHPNNPP